MFIYGLNVKCGCHSTDFQKSHTCTSGPGSSVGIATELQAGRSGDRILVGVRFSAPVQTGPGAYPASCTMGTVSFPRVQSGRGVTPHPLLAQWSRNSRAIPLFLPMGRTACTEPQCLYKGAFYLYLALP